MINGAVEIIAGVPGKNLDPLLLARSQTPDSISLMLIAYETSLNHVEDRCYDLLFLRGQQIYDCARMTGNLRFRLPVEKIVANFKSRYCDEGTRIHLFKVPNDSIEQFRSTFYYSPSLKIRLESLTKKQIQKLLNNTDCGHGIVEHDDYVQRVPKITLMEYHSLQELTAYVPPSLKGQLYLYDIEKNMELLKECLGLSEESFSSGAADTINRQETFILKRPANEDSARQSEMLNDANQFTELIKQILNNPEKKPEANKTLNLEFPEIPVKRPVHHIDELRQKTDVPELSRTKQSPRRQVKKRSEDSSVSEKNTEHSEVIVLFDRFFRSYRRIIYDCMGEKGDACIALAESQVKISYPEFNISALTETEAVHVLDVVEYVSKKVPLLKRSHVRNAVLSLIAEVYNKQYELLERTKTLDRVEQFYYELKR